MKQPLRIIAINGSLREGSHTGKALQIALKGAEELNVETELLELRDYDLVFCDGKRPIWPPDVMRLKEQVHQAQGIILGTPEYHSSFSGVLKNALDLMGFEEFGGKVVGLIGVSGGAMGAMSALSALRVVGRSLHSWVVPHQVSIPQAWKHFDDDGNLNSDELAERLRAVGRQVARFAFLHTSEQAQEFLRLWEESQPNPGGMD